MVGVWCGRDLWWVFVVKRGYVRCLGAKGSYCLCLGATEVVLVVWVEGRYGRFLVAKAVMVGVLVSRAAMVGVWVQGKAAMVGVWVQGSYGRGMGARGAWAGEWVQRQVGSVSGGKGERV